MDKKKKDKIIISVSVISIFVICTYLLFSFNILSFSNVNGNTTLKLASTETNTKIKEGIYITDVSEVVEETMPAIVSITSKTLIQSGY